MKFASLQKFAFVTLFAAAIVGCEENHEASETRSVARKITLPEDAKVVAEGVGELKYRAMQDGRVFVFDVEDSALENARHVRTGQILVLKPDENVVTLDGHKIVEQDLKKDHTHRLLFEPE